MIFNVVYVKGKGTRARGGFFKWRKGQLYKQKNVSLTLSQAHVTMIQRLFLSLSLSFEMLLLLFTASRIEIVGCTRRLRRLSL